MLGWARSATSLTLLAAQSPAARLSITIGSLITNPLPASGRSRGGPPPPLLPPTPPATSGLHLATFVAPPQVLRLHRKLEDYHVSDYNSLR